MPVKEGEVAQNDGIRAITLLDESFMNDSCMAVCHAPPGCPRRAQSPRT